MKFDLFDGGGDGEYNSVMMVEIPEIFAKQDHFTEYKELYNIYRYVVHAR